MENQNSVCFVAKINEIKEIPGADNIEQAIIGGWNCITKKGEHKVNDMVVVATTDAVIPLDLSDNLGVTNYLRKGQRVRTVKLRGVYSECLLIPFTYANISSKKIVTEGSDCMELQTSTLELDLTLARGLNYYTGTILEVKSKDVEFGSIGGGGRYDDLTGIFGLPGVPGVGISFGADRIYDVLMMQNLFPNSAITGSEVLFANFSQIDERKTLPLIQQMRNSGIKAEIYPEISKLKKQFEYAEKKGIPYLMIYGEEERAAQIVLTKELSSGKQLPVPISKLDFFQELFQ